MVRGIFTGNVRLDYARHRHALWLADIENTQIDALAVKSEPNLPITEKSPLPETQIPPQQDLLPEAEGQPAIISDVAPNQKTTPENKE
jgi:hypothetical protein